jgi:hypothetical protein
LGWLDIDPGYFSRFRRPFNCQLVLQNCVHLKVVSSIMASGY